MEELKISETLPNTKEWANTATRILRELIKKYNKLVEVVHEKHPELKEKIEKI